MSIPEQLYGELFPAGSEVSVDESFSERGLAPTLYECEVTVDGETVIQSGSGGYGDYESAINVFDLPIEMSDAESVTGDYDARVWPGVAIAQASCPELGSDGSFMVYIRSEYPADEAESQRVLSELIQPYMAAAVELIPEYGCES